MLDLYATASRGTEDIVAKELRAIGLAPGKRDPGGVPFPGGLAEGLRACRPRPSCARPRPAR